MDWDFVKLLGHLLFLEVPGVRSPVCNHWWEVRAQLCHHVPPPCGWRCFPKLATQYLPSCILFCPATLLPLHQEMKSASSTPLKPGSHGTALATRRQRKQCCVTYGHSPWRAWGFAFCRWEASQYISNSSISWDHDAVGSLKDHSEPWGMKCLVEEGKDQEAPDVETFKIMEF